MSYLFSIIVPTYNSEQFIRKTIAELKEIKEEDCEIIMIDDCSTDKTLRICEKYCKHLPDFQICSTEKNGGPGKARNVGIDAAKGDYIIFLDSDDRLTGGALSILRKCVGGGENDIAVFDFAYENDINIPCRRDRASFQKEKKELLGDYLSLQMDGSVIYSVFRRQFILNHEIRFRDGFHEDVDFLFKGIFYAEKISILDEILYIKRNRKESIIHTITPKHIEGFFGAYREMKDRIEEDPFLQERWSLGLQNLVAVKLRDILRYCQDNEKLRKENYKVLYSLYSDLRSYGIFNQLPIKTQYMQLAEVFLEGYEKETGEVLITARLNDILMKRWSCYDLEHSIFLGPDEIRTCCKRFFRDGIQKGDVILHKVEAEAAADEIVDNIVREKHRIIRGMNAGYSEECRGCPFMKFEKWGEMPVNIEKVSFEYHSLCNLRCQYCSDLYYGGKNVSYDILEVIELLKGRGMLRECKSCVWGGGEPTLEKNFDNLIEKMTDGINGNHIVITNAVKYSSKLQDLLNQEKVSITTSVDAGTDGTYKEVRGRNKFSEVWENLKKYASVNPGNVTIKYILLPQNQSDEDLRGFAKQVGRHDLWGCNFQISTDFKNAQIEEEDICSMLKLYSLLKEGGARVVFLDELLRERMPCVSGEMLEAAERKLYAQHYNSYIAKASSYESVLLWGSENQISSLLNKAEFFRHVKCEAIVDSNTANIGNECCGYRVENIRKYADSELPLVIAAVQGTPRIYREIEKSGLEKRIIGDLIL